MLQLFLKRLGEATSSGWVGVGGDLGCSGDEGDGWIVSLVGFSIGAGCTAYSIGPTASQKRALGGESRALWGECQVLRGENPKYG